MEPLFIGPMEVGLQRNLKPFMIPDQAFPSLSDCFTFRGRVRRKPGQKLLGRLRRVITAQTQTSTAGVNYSIADILSSVRATEANASLVPGDLVLTIDPGGPNATVLDDNGLGAFVVTSGPYSISASSINYVTGAISVTFSVNPGVSTVSASYNYYPSLPVMGISLRQGTSINSNQTIVFDQKYAYRYTSFIFSELPSTYVTRWTGNDSDFFWTTNYGRDASNNALFWATNNKAATGFAVTNVGGSVAGPPSTANITAAGNNFAVGDTVTFLNMSGGVANYQVGTVTAAGSPFSVTNPGTGVYTNAAVTGYAVDLTSDGIKYYDGTTWNTAIPRIDSTTFLMGGLIILPFKNRLLVFNTLEGTPLTAVRRSNRVRFSQNSIGGAVTAFDTAWRSDIIGRGGFEDAPTDEQIVSAGFLKDDIIVYFEKSTWKLVYQGNEIRPFAWVKINSELGAESTFSFVNFDNGLLGMGNVGVHTTNGISVSRIDEIIPDEVFNISNANSGPKRVFGIRDYFLEMAYFSYPEYQADGFTYLPTYPNKILALNYRTNAWAFFNESYTCLGYIQRPASLTWATADLTWEEAQFSWNSGSNQLDFLTIGAGNQQGFVMYMEPDQNSTVNTRAITGISTTTITSPNHNLFSGNFIYISGCLGSTNLNDQIFRVLTTPTVSTFTIATSGNAGYIGGGVFKVLSNIKITSKMFTPFWSYGKKYRLKYAEYLFDRTEDGQVTCDIFVDTKNTDSLNNPNNTSTSDTGLVADTCLLGSNVVFTKPETLYATQQLAQEVIWHRQKYNVEGETFQIQITLSDAQLQDLDIVDEDIVLHGIIFHFEPAGIFR